MTSFTIVIIQYISLINLIRLVIQVPQDPAGCFLQQKWSMIPAFFTFLCCRFWSGWRRPCSRPRFTCCPPTTSVGSATLGSCPLTPASRKSLCPWVGRHLTLKYEIHRVRKEFPSTRGVNGLPFQADWTLIAVIYEWTMWVLCDGSGDLSRCYSCPHTVSTVIDFWTTCNWTPALQSPMKHNKCYH